MPDTACSEGKKNPKTERKFILSAFFFAALLLQHSQRSMLSAGNDEKSSFFFFLTSPIMLVNDFAWEQQGENVAAAVIEATNFPFNLILFINN